jgi:hypothetical protein
MTTWETIEVPRGAYIGWGSKKGQHVTGRVLDYSSEGGTDFNQNVCPSATIELTEDAASFNKEGERSLHEAGSLVQLNAGQVSLRRALRAADPSPGDLIKITLINLAKTDKGSVKEYDIKIARGAGGKVEPKAAVAEVDDDEPPF